MKIPDFKNLLIIGFATLGPLGNLCTPSFLPEAFRSYYFLLPAFPLFFLKLRAAHIKPLLFFTPLLIYCFLSALIVELFGEPKEPYPLFRYFLLLFSFCFVVGAAVTLKNLQAIYHLIGKYLIFFFISLGIGYIFYIGFYLDLISFSFITRFSIIAQFGYGFLRFSPGSYPNEYGTVASFVLSILTLHLIQPCKELRLSKKWTSIFFIATFAALLLTTTRSAYLGYLFCFIYIAWKTNKLFYSIGALSFIFFSVFIFFKYFGINLLGIITSGFNLIAFQDGSAGERVSYWSTAVENFPSHLFLGNGFASLTNLHNVYLQLLLELGLVGLLIALGTTLFWIWTSRLCFFNVDRHSEYFFLRSVKIMGLIQILWFALTNHNLNHHLTWFILFLFIATFHENTPKEELTAQ